MSRLPIIASLAIVAAAPVHAQAVDPSPRITTAQAARFFGDRYVPGLGRGKVARTWIEATVPTRGDRSLRDGYRFVAGCRAHDCPTQAAAIVAPGGAIVGAAMVALKCAATCEDTSTGFLFLRRSTPAWARDVLTAWARKALVANASMEPSTGGIEVVRLDEGAAPPR